MRIGTWNLEGRWSREHQRILKDVQADVWLLTEVNFDASLNGYDESRSPALMQSTKHWSAVLARGSLEPEPGPHAASAKALVDGQSFCSSVLPWLPWMPSGVWGGDWNQPLQGPMWGFSRAAQADILRVVCELGLQVPTAELPGRTSPQRTIDHIGVPASWRVLKTEYVAVPPELSDHDLYWIDVAG